MKIVRCNTVGVWFNRGGVEVYVNRDQMKKRPFTFRADHLTYMVGNTIAVTPKFSEAKQKDFYLKITRGAR